MNCTREELENMPPYTTIHYVQKGIPNYPLGMAGTQVSNVSPLPGDSWVEKAEKVHLPDGELDVSQDMVVKSEGSKVGKVDGLVVDPERAVRSPTC